MKKLLFLSLALLFTGSVAFAQAPASPKKTAEGDGVSVVYGAPSKKGREIFGGLVPYGEVWRTGANNATELTLSKDGKVGGVNVKAGTYTLFTIPQEDGNWTVILNPTLGQWGAYGYAKIKDADLPHIPAKASATNGTVELFSIYFEGSDMVIAWDDTKVMVPIEM
ncbi:DUF2911 domain-containing protein [Jiulongibacter sediminis]|jgi:hypothetical protein|uniref:DUF2911 domain-containing protein n=1 Tax=Jiulongibacter sediminis TaxID=1605367 RepID=UPI0026F0DFDB|nr:DUF2911 domain-containing protein [Jiulongibacter sediminis]